MVKNGVGSEAKKYIIN